jgi:hypothetical protein
MANLQLNFFFNLGGHVPKADLQSRAPNHPIFAARVESKRIPRYVDLISDVPPFGRLWYAEPDAISNETNYAKFYSRSHDAVIRVYDAAGNVIETHEHMGDFKEF